MVLRNDYTEIKGFSVRNVQCMIQFFNEYNQELTIVKETDAPITQSVIAQLEKYNFTLHIKHLGWTHNTLAAGQGCSCPVLVHGAVYHITLEYTLFTRSHQA